MVEPALTPLDIWLWEYPAHQRNCPCVHLTARPAAYDAVVGLLTRMRETPGGGRCSIPLRPLKRADVAKISGNYPYHSLSQLQLAVVPTRGELQQMSVRTEDQRVVIEITISRLDDLFQGLRDIQAGTGDYSIAPRDDPKHGLSLGTLDRESQPLWFWPCFGHLGPV